MDANAVEGQIRRFMNFIKTTTINLKSKLHGMTKLIFWDINGVAKNVDSERINSTFAKIAFDNQTVRLLFYLIINFHQQGNLLSLFLYKDSATHWYASRLSSVNMAINDASLFLLPFFIRYQVKYRHFLNSKSSLLINVCFALVI